MHCNKLFAHEILISNSAYIGIFTFFLENILNCSLIAEKELKRSMSWEHREAWAQPKLRFPNRELHLGCMIIYIK